MCLKRDAGFEFRNLFDTMWAARILGWQQIGLAAILEEHFGVRLDKRWQRYNWGRRPLERAALAYAHLDSHYLLSLRDIQMRDLAARERIEEAREAFDQVAAVAAQPSHEPRADDFWRVKGAGDLTPRSQAILRELYLFREREARRRDWPPFKIMGDKTLLALAQAKPRHLHDLEHFGMTPLQVKRYGEGVIDAVTRGLSASTPRLPRSSPPDYGALNRYEKLRAWRRQVAAERGVEPDVVVCNAVLMAVAHRQPSTLQDLEGIEGLGPWKLKTYGEQLVEALK